MSLLCPDERKVAHISPASDVSCSDLAAVLPQANNENGSSFFGLSSVTARQVLSCVCERVFLGSKQNVRFLRSSAEQKANRWIMEAGGDVYRQQSDR